MLKIRYSNTNNFFLEHFYTIRYNMFHHIFQCSTTYQKLVFYPGIPLTIQCKKIITKFHFMDKKSIFKMDIIHKTKKFILINIYLKISF